MSFVFLFGGRHCYVTVHLAEHDRYFTSYTRITNRKYMRDTSRATRERRTLRRRALKKNAKEMRAERRENEWCRRSARNDKHVRYAEEGDGIVKLFAALANGVVHYASSDTEVTATASSFCFFSSL